MGNISKPRARRLGGMRGELANAMGLLEVSEYGVKRIEPQSDKGQDDKAACQKKGVKTAEHPYLPRDSENPTSPPPTRLTS